MTVTLSMLAKRIAARVLHISGIVIPNEASKGIMGWCKMRLGRCWDIQRTVTEVADVHLMPTFSTRLGIAD